jgi:hypothetical protein
MVKWLSESAGECAGAVGGGRGGAGAEVAEEFLEGGFEGVGVFGVLVVCGDVVCADFAGEVFDDASLIRCPGYARGNGDKYRHRQ